MNNSALFLSLVTQLLIISVTFYSFYLVMKKPKPEDK